MPLLSIDSFTFEIGKATFDDLSHSLSARWAEQNRLLRAPALQFIGVGTLEKTISGTIHTANDAGGKAVGSKSLNALGAMMAAGIPYEVVSGDGKAFGKWVIRSINNRDSVFMDNGKARKQDFSVTISYYGEDDETTNPDALRVAN